MQRAVVRGEPSLSYFPTEMSDKHEEATEGQSDVKGRACVPRSRIKMTDVTLVVIPNSMRSNALVTLHH